MGDIDPQGVPVLILGVLIGPVVSEEKMFEIVDGWTTDYGQTPE